MTDSAGRIGEFDIAVIGLSCRFPKAAKPGIYWTNLRDGIDCVSFFSKDELRAAGISDEILSHPDYIPAAGILDGVDRFDAGLFGYLPRETMLLDPQQRVFLEISWAALEDAGYAPRGIDQLRVGVYAGATMNTYLTSLLLNEPSIVERFGEQTIMLTNDKDFLPLRVSHQLDLRGPSVNIQSACATALVAVHSACRSLISGEVDLALAGAASVRVPQRAGYWYREQGTSSRTGRCRPFDADADGSVPGSGAGIVVLKRLAEAVKDGDLIRAVIKGSGVTHDGANKASFTAPSVSGQARAILDAFATAQISSDTVSYVECHGTATKIGDPIEIGALTRAFQEAADGQGRCGVGSVKANIGHLDAAAGMAGLIKTIFALEHRLIPPTLHFRRPNPELHFEETPFYVVDRAKSWDANGLPRRAGVNSIGMGGVNAHVLVEEAPKHTPGSSAKKWFVLPVSAQSPTALNASVVQLAEHLDESNAISLADAAYTLQVGRAALEHRCAVVCSSNNRKQMLSMKDVPGTRVAERPAILFMFPGQASDYPGMGAGLYQCNGIFREAFDTCGRAAQKASGINLSSLLAVHGHDREQTTDTAMVQMALFAVEWALASTLSEAGVIPDGLMGHSLGEFVAATMAGVFSLEDAVTLVLERGRLMQAAPPGAMLAVSMPEEQLADLLGDGVHIASVNAPDRCVVSGAKPVVEDIERRLSDRGIPCKRLRVAHAFHSPMMTSAADAFERIVAGFPMRAPDRPIYSTVTGTRLLNEEATNPTYWARHLTAPVHFLKAFRRATDTKPILAIECGPGTILSSYARRICPAIPVLSSIGADMSGDSPEERDFLTLCARVWEQGVPVRWGALHRSERRHRLPLPTYPFQGAPAWIRPARVDSLSGVAPQRPADTRVVTGAGGALNAEISIYPDRIVIQTQPVASTSAARPPNIEETANTPVSPPVATTPTVDTGRDVEVAVREIVEDMLGLTGVDRDAGLVNLGADSLAMTQLLSRLKKTLAPGLDMSALRKHGSIAGITALIRAGTPELGQPSPAPASPTTQELSGPTRDDAIEALVAQLQELPPDEVARQMAWLKGLSHEQK